jgi:hypothetical protein
MGRIVYKDEWQLQSGPNSILIPSATWSGGLYFFRFTAASGDRIVKKMLKEN